MNIVDEYRRDYGRVLDRLVDGELGQQERRELLAALDDEPGAWRQCALAFLEAQNWRFQLSRLATEPLVAQVTAGERAPATHVRSTPSHAGAVGGWLAVAASLLVAFGIGTRFPNSTRDGSGHVSPGHVSPGHGALVAKQSDASGERLAAAPASGAQPKHGAQPKASQPEESQALAAQAEANQTPAPLRTLTLKPVGGEGGESIELPLIESDAEGVIAASAQPSALSGSLIRQFEKDGFVVDRQERLWPVDLPDGRRVLVPVEEVDIRSPQIERL